MSYGPDHTDFSGSDMISGLELLRDAPNIGNSSHLVKIH